MNPPAMRTRAVSAVVLFFNFITDPGQFITRNTVPAGTKKHPILDIFIGGLKQLKATGEL